MRWKYLAKTFKSQSTLNTLYQVHRKWRDPFTKKNPALKIHGKSDKCCALKASPPPRFSQFSIAEFKWKKSKWISVTHQAPAIAFLFWEFWAILFMRVDVRTDGNYVKLMTTYFFGRGLVDQRGLLQFRLLHLHFYYNASSTKQTL